MKQPMVDAAERIAAIDDPVKRRIARIGIKEDAVRYRHAARRTQADVKLADAVAKFGGGSLLTATVLLIVGGQAGGAIIGVAVLTLLLFVAGTIFWVIADMRTAQPEFQADWLESLLKDTER